MPLRLTIIGGGPGANAAAFAAARAGMNVTIVEKSYIGGTCLNYGCIPTKTIKASADAFELAKRLPDFGISLDCTPSVNMAKIMERKNNVLRILRGGLEKTCAKLKITVLKGHGQIIPPRSVRIHDEQGNTQDIESDFILIATGSGILELPNLKFDHKYILNSDDALELTNVPPRLCIVGGGVIGCEMAFIFRSLGSEVTLVEGLERLLPIPSIDVDISKFLQKEMKKQGIACKLASTITDVNIKNDKVFAKFGPSPFVQNQTPAKEAEIEVDAVLVTVGRTPQTEGLGLEEAKVKTDKRGWIEVDEVMQTSAANIYAIGDVLGPAKVMLAHVAAAEGVCAVENMLAEPKGDISRPMDYITIPSAIFTSPEVGCVGYSEASALENGEDVFCPTIQMRELGKAHAMGELAGFCKLVIRKDDHKILGAHIAGAHATDLIAELTLAIQMGARIEDIANTIHAHPTLAEGVFEAALLGLES